MLLLLLMPRELLLLVMLPLEVAHGKRRNLRQRSSRLKGGVRGVARVDLLLLDLMGEVLRPRQQLAEGVIRHAGRWGGVLLGTRTGQRQSCAPGFSDPDGSDDLRQTSASLNLVLGSYVRIFRGLSSLEPKEGSRRRPKRRKPRENPPSL